MVVKITQVSNACKRLREQWLVHGKCLTKLMIIIDIIILKIIQISRLYLTRIFNALVIQCYFLNCHVGDSLLISG